jgi:hypothetical protein
VYCGRACALLSDLIDDAAVRCARRSALSLCSLSLSLCFLSLLSLCFLSLSLSLSCFFFYFFFFSSCFSVP